MLALIGHGRWGQPLHRAFAALTDVHHVVTRHAGNLDLALHDPRVEAVAIATPIPTHFEIARRALTTGRHVFLEKPGTPSAAALTELRLLAHAWRRVLQVGYVFLHHPAWLELERIHCADPIVALRGTWWKLGTFGDPIGLSLLCHDIALACRLFGEPPVVALEDAAGAVTVCDRVRVRLTFPTGEAILSVDRAAPSQRKTVAVTTTSGRMLVWEDQGLSELRREHGIYQPTWIAMPGTALERQCRRFLERCASGAPGDGLPVVVHQVLARLGLP